MTQVSEEKKPDVVEVTRCLHCWQSMEIRQIKFSKTTLRGQWLHMIQPIDEECFTAEGWCSQCGKHFTVDSGWIEDAHAGQTQPYSLKMR